VAIQAEKTHQEFYEENYQFLGSLLSPFFKNTPLRFNNSIKISLSSSQESLCRAKKDSEYARETWRVKRAIVEAVPLRYKRNYLSRLV